MAVDMFINIEGIPGESKDSKHGDEVDVLSWSWGMSQSGSFHTGGGGGAGKVNVQDLSFTKWLDKASAPLSLFCCNGDHIPKAVLTVRKAGKTPLEYFKITMTKVMVTSVSTGGSGGEDQLTENVTLNFAHVETEYQLQKDDGTGEAAGGLLWNIETNESA